MKKNLVILSVVTLITCSGLAQEKSTFSSRLGLGFVPQYTISGGMRFDVDLSISKTLNQWLIISPEVFMLTGSRYGHKFEELSGFGLGLKHKIYLSPNSMKPHGVYAQYGIMFQHFSITENRQYAKPVTENGVQYFEVVVGELNTKLNKFGGNFHLGYQWLLGDRVYLDIYTGAGIRVSHNNQNEGFDTWYNDFWADYGYSGTLLDGGFRVGFYF